VRHCCIQLLLINAVHVPGARPHHSTVVVELVAGQVADFVRPGFPASAGNYLLQDVRPALMGWSFRPTVRSGQKTGFVAVESRQTENFQAKNYPFEDCLTTTHPMAYWQRECYSAEDLLVNNSLD